MMDVIIETARPSDLEAVLTLLKTCDLPLDGLAEHFDCAVVARSEGRLVGCAALEIYGPDALLRSVAVDGSLRELGLGKDLTRAALELGRSRAIKGVYLLTTTAGGFFPRFGFQPARRDDVPEAVKASIEFTSACPLSALVMKMSI